MDKKVNTKNDEKMEIEEFLKLDKPTIQAFLKLGEEKAAEYDFSNDGAKIYPNGKYTYLVPSGNYKEKVGLEKFFAYMSVMHKEDIFKVISLEEQEKINSYGNVIDPDSNSQLLQEIYKILWDENGYMKNCLRIQGDTLNSANTTLNKLYENYEEEIDMGKPKCEQEKYKRGRKRISIKLILEKKINETDFSITNKIIENKDLENFVSKYHTIGNFMPIPFGCNCPRGTGVVKDYWDLTLLHIYNYYIKGDRKELKPILLNEKELSIETDFEIVKDYQEWLDSWGEGQDGWNNFVQKNYLGNAGDDKKIFVPKEKENYGKPRELWKGHFDQYMELDKNGLPKYDAYPKDDQCIEYFKNANEWILQRGILMVKELSNRINQLKIINKE